MSGPPNVMDLCPQVTCPAALHHVVGFQRCTAPRGPFCRRVGSSGRVQKDPDISFLEGEKDTGQLRIIYTHVSTGGR